MMRKEKGTITNIYLYPKMESSFFIKWPGPEDYVNEIHNFESRRAADDKWIGAQLLNLDMTSLLSRDLYNHPYNHRRSNQYRQTVYIEYNSDTSAQYNLYVRLDIDQRGGAIGN